MLIRENALRLRDAELQELRAIVDKVRKSVLMYKASQNSIIQISSSNHFTDGGSGSGSYWSVPYLAVSVPNKC